MLKIRLKVTCACVKTPYFLKFCPGEADTKDDIQVSAFPLSLFCLHRDKQNRLYLLKPKDTVPFLGAQISLTQFGESNLQNFQMYNKKSLH